MVIKPLISVCVITYNHEAYISQAIDSIIRQKGKFNLEIIIGNDFSKDGTKDIIENYKEKFTAIIKPVHHVKNIGMMNNFIDTYNRCSGDYIAFLEGDDYWTDPKKLQKQFNIMQNNPKIAFCFTDVKEVDSNENYLSRFSDNRELPKDGLIPLKDIIEAKIRKVHIGTIFSRNFKIEFPDWFRNVMAGDFIFSVIIGSKGDIYYVNEVTCAYRKHLEGVTNRAFNLAYYESLKFSLKELDQYLGYKYNRSLNRAIKSRKAQYFLYELTKSKKLISRFYYALLTISIISRTNLTFRDILWMVFKKK